jgi:hypothetical protein
MSSKSVVLGLVLLSALSLAACADAPKEEVQAAQAALDEAKAAGADSYAAEAYGKAQETMAQANAEVEVQKGKFLLMRSFGRTKQLYRQAKADADKARSDAAAGKVQAEGEARTEIDAARAVLDGAILSVATAPAGKDSRADLEAMKGDLEALRATLGEAETAFGSGDYATARQRADKVRQEAGAIQADVAQALRKTQRG